MRLKWSVGTFIRPLFNPEILSSFDCQPLLEEHAGSGEPSVRMNSKLAEHGPDLQFPTLRRTQNRALTEESTTCTTPAPLTPALSHPMGEGARSRMRLISVREGPNVRLVLGSGSRIV